MDNLSNIDCSLDIDLESSLLKYSNYKLIDIIKEICDETGSEFISWNQFTDYGIGRINFKETEVKVYWEDFPNILTFDFTAFQETQNFYNILRNSNLIL